MNIQNIKRRKLSAPDNLLYKSCLYNSNYINSDLTRNLNYTPIEKIFNNENTRVNDMLRSIMEKSNSVHVSPYISKSIGSHIKTHNNRSKRTKEMYKEFKNNVVQKNSNNNINNNNIGFSKNCIFDIKERIKNSSNSLIKNNSCNNSSNNCSNINNMNISGFNTNINNNTNSNNSTNPKKFMLFGKNKTIDVEINDINNNNNNKTINNLFNKNSNNEAISNPTKIVNLDFSNISEINRNLFGNIQWNEETSFKSGNNNMNVSNSSIIEEDYNINYNNNHNSPNFCKMSKNDLYNITPKNSNLDNTGIINSNERINNLTIYNNFDKESKFARNLSFNNIDQDKEQNCYNENETK